jgi:hypothetical protein
VLRTATSAMYLATTMFTAVYSWNPTRIMLDASSSSSPGPRYIRFTEGEMDWCIEDSSTGYVRNIITAACGKSRARSEACARPWAASSKSSPSVSWPSCSTNRAGTAMPKNSAPR